MPICHATRRIVLLAAALCCLGSTLSQAQSTYPSRTIVMLVPQAAGGTNDIVGRVVGQRLAEVLGGSVVIDNRPGAGGNIGTPAGGAGAQGWPQLADDDQQQPGHQPGAVQAPRL